MWEALRDLVYRDGRCVHCVENAGLLPEDTTYDSEQLAYTLTMPRDLKKQVRESWLKSALKAVKGADFVCVDPDNGIAKEEKIFSKDGPKYTYISDLHQFWGERQSLVIYQHMPMDRAARGRTLEIADELREEFGVDPISMLFSRGTSRTYLVVPQPIHREVIERRITGMMETRWREHFEWVR